MCIRDRKGEVWLGNINFINAPEIFLPEISIIGEGNKTKIFTDGDDLFFDKRKKSTGILLKAKDISIKTKDFLVSDWIPKGICLGLSLIHILVENTYHSLILMIG